MEASVELDRRIAGDEEAYVMGFGGLYLIIV